MLNPNNAIVIFRFSEYRWIKKMVDGNLSFSCAGNYINQAQKTDNDIQGDAREAVFARLKYDDAKIGMYKDKLGKDLEIIPDNNYVLLRRKSAKLKPIFCFYNYLVKNANEEGKFEREGYTEITHNFDERIFSGFTGGIGRINGLSEERQSTAVAIRADVFAKNVYFSILTKGYGHVMHSVDYDYFKNETFEVPLTPKYDELFYKFPQYEYQHEGRIILYDENLNHFTDRFNVEIQKFSDDGFKVAQGPFNFTVGVKVGRLE